MDAVELPYPVDVAAPMLMSSEGFVRAGVTLTEAEARQPDGVTVLVSPPIDRCSSLPSQKDIKMASESTCSDKIPDTELCRHGSQLPSFRGDDVSEHLCGTTQNCVGQYPRPEMLQRKAAKGSRSGTVCSKRRRLAQTEESLSLARDNDKKDMIDELESYPKRCTSPESSQLVKQKNNFSKRADRRSFKVPAKVKYDSFSTKVGSLNLSSVAGGNNFLGAYGLKLDNHDITKLTDDPALNDLLDGTYKCSTSVKDKGKKKENNDEDFLLSVRKAFSVLQLSRPVQSQSLADIDNFSIKKMSTSISSTVSGEKGEFYTTDLSSCNKGSCSKHDTPANPLEFPPYQPEDILKRLVLAEPKDLESLLLDAAKSSVSSRNTFDIRSGKHMSRRVSLPPFPWSHTFNGHCRSNVDATKLSTTRGTCHGRWVRIGNVSRPPRIAADCLANLESLTYDHSLVPSELSSENKVPPSIAVSLPSGEADRLSYATCSKTSHILQDSGGPVNCQGNAGHCPRLLAAAQTLYDMATLSSKPNSEGMIRWSKKSSQKATKGRKLKSNEKLIETFATSVPLLASNNALRRVDPLMSSKKPKLSTVESSKDIDRSNCLRKGPIYWSTPRSSRSSPGKSIKEIAETKNSTAGILKHSCTMPPPVRVLDKACNSNQKVRKLLPMDWNRRRDGLD